MKLLELTDAKTGTEKEYVNVEEIARFEPYVSPERMFGKSELKGSTVYTKGGGEYGQTRVVETPARIAQMIKNKEYLEA